MIKYSEAEKVLVERIKKVQASVVCDTCGKEIVAKKRSDNWDQRRLGDESLFIFKTFDEFLEWWPREKEIWPEAIILDIKRV